MMPIDKQRITKEGLVDRIYCSLKEDFIVRFGNSDEVGVLERLRRTYVGTDNRPNYCQSDEYISMRGGICRRLVKTSRPVLLSIALEVSK